MCFQVLISIIWITVTRYPLENVNTVFSKIKPVCYSANVCQYFPIAVPNVILSKNMFLSKCSQKRAILVIIRCFLDFYSAYIVRFHRQGLQKSHHDRIIWFLPRQSAGIQFDNYVHISIMNSFVICIKFLWHWLNRGFLLQHNIIMWYLVICPLDNGIRIFDLTQGNNKSKLSCHCSLFGNNDTYYSQILCLGHIGHSSHNYTKSKNLKI